MCIEAEEAVHNWHFAPFPGIGAKYCDFRDCMSVCLCVWLSVYLSVFPLAYLKDRISRLHEIFCMIPVAVARSSSDGVMYKSCPMSIVATVAHLS